jgi:hypothetical protein
MWMMYGLCVWNGVSGVACVKIAGFVWHLHI